MRAGFVRPLAGAATVTGLAVGSPGAAAGVAAAATPDPAATSAVPAVPAASDTTAAAAVTYSWLYARTPNQQRGALILNQDPLSSVTFWASGSGSTRTDDECDRSINGDPGGPIPYGRYSVIQTSANWPGTAVRGPVLRLSDGVCYDGHTTRTELFVHSTYPWSDSHYVSAGCIKISSKGSPSNASGDIRAVYDAYFKHGHPNTLYVAFGS